MEILSEAVFRGDIHSHKDILFYHDKFSPTQVVSKISVSEFDLGAGAITYGEGRDWSKVKIGKGLEIGSPSYKEKLILNGSFIYDWTDLNSQLSFLKPENLSVDTKFIQTQRIRINGARLSENCQKFLVTTSAPANIFNISLVKRTEDCIYDTPVNADIWFYDSNPGQPNCVCVGVTLSQSFVSQFTQWNSNNQTEVLFMTIVGNNCSGSNCGGGPYETTDWFPIS